MKKLKSLMYYYGTDYSDWNYYIAKRYRYERPPNLSYIYQSFMNSKAPELRRNEIFIDFVNQAADMDLIIKMRIKSQ